MNVFVINFIRDLDDIEAIINNKCLFIQITLDWTSHLEVDRMTLL